MVKNRQLSVPETGETWEPGPATSARISFLALAMTLLLAGSANIVRTGSALSAETRPPGKITLLINEFMAGSDGSIRGPQGDTDDWIEIYNYGDAPIDMAGMYLTDDLSDPDAWQVPGNNPALTTVPAHGYVLIWADSEPSKGALHAGFKLSASGEQLGLFAGILTVFTLLDFKISRKACVKSGSRS